MLTETERQTLKIATDCADEIRDAFVDEVERLLRSGACSEDISRNILFSVALENLADNYLRGRRRTTRTYKNLI